MFQDYVLLEWGCEDQEFAVRTLKNGTFTETEAGWLSELEKLTASPPEDLRAARIQTNLAMLYFCHQRYDLSELYFERALASCIRVAGVNSPQTAEYLNNLAGLYYAQ
ncbi:MAG TPA: tetratricopeptide repeat protein, partial [Candidatus Obscuribacterales bacterium]